MVQPVFIHRRLSYDQNVIYSGICRFRIFSDIQAIQETLEE